MIRLLELIQGRGRWNAQDLSNELECSERTVYRDLRVLELAGIPYFEDKAAKCYRIRGDFKFPVLNLTDEELLDLGTASAITSAVGLNVGAGPKSTIRKLSIQTPDQSAKILSDAEKLVQVFGLNLADHGRHLELIRTVQWSLLKGLQLIGDYRSPYHKKSERLTLCPIRLCLIKQAWYLIAQHTGDRVTKTYRICRFKTLRMTTNHVDVPTDFDLKHYLGNAWGVFRGDQSYCVEIEFSRDSAPLVVETIWHHSQKVAFRKDGTVRLKFVVDGLSEIVHWILGWSSRAKVIEPPELKEMVLVYLRKAIELNST